MFDRQRYEPKRVILSSLRKLARELDPALLSCDDAVATMEFGAEVERLGCAIKTIAAGRAAEGDVWRRAGDRNAADWLAKRTGSTVGDARAVLETAAKLADAPATSAALRAGELSARQAAAIAPAAAASPRDEERLLDIARSQALQKLTDECARVRAAADPDPRARHERIHRERFWRKWRRPDGMAGGSYGGTPDEVALFEARVQAWIDERLDRARRAGESEPSEAYAFDGLMAAAAAAADALRGCSDHAPSDDADVDADADADAEAEGDGVAEGRSSTDAADDTDADGDGVAAGGSSTGDATASTGPDLEAVRRARGGRGRKRFRERRELIGIVDLADWRHRFNEPGPTCEIPGVGIIPMHVACEMFGDALLDVVIRDGVDVVAVVHSGRVANRVQETAIFVQQHGRCATLGCGSPICEIDHVIDYRATAETTLLKLRGLCGPCHDRKKRGHEYTSNDDGTITWTRPDGTQDRPPGAAA